MARVFYHSPSLPFLIIPHQTIANIFQCSLKRDSTVLTCWLMFNAYFYNTLLPRNTSEVTLIIDALCYFVGGRVLWRETLPASSLSLPPSLPIGLPRDYQEFSLPLLHSINYAPSWRNLLPPSLIDELKRISLALINFTLIELVIMPFCE